MLTRNGDEYDQKAEGVILQRLRELGGDGAAVEDLRSCLPAAG
jgi:hypothetical protein